MLLNLQKVKNNFTSNIYESDKTEFTHFNLAQSNTIRFANYYGDHMVLQRAPKSARVWGYTPLKCEDVTVMLDQTEVKATVTPEASELFHFNAGLFIEKEKKSNSYHLNSLNEIISYRSVQVGGSSSCNCCWRSSHNYCQLF